MSNVYTPVLKGVHIDVSLPITRLGQKESFQDVEFLEIRFVNNRLSDQLVVYTADKIKLTDNIVSVVIPDTDSSRLQLGFYDVQFTYRKTNVLRPNQYEPFKLVVPAFSLVATTAELGVDVATDVEVQSVVINGELFIARDGLNGASAFQIAAAHGFEGDEAEWLYSLKKPALDAATAAAMAANAANDAADAVDAATSEINTVMQFFAQTESARTQAEQDRVNAESSRQQAEESRNTKESERNQAETARGQAEQGRSNAEQTREQAEASRSNSETARQQAETSRSSTETARTQAEQARVQSEQARAQAETARTEAESDRETAENARTEAEQSRKTAETARTQAEQARGTTFDQKIEESEQATAAANTAAGAQNTYNVTVAVPLAAGSYYTKSTARAAVPVASRKLGLVITYATADKIWYSEKYIGSTVAGWTTEENWEYVPTAANMATKTDKTELEQLRSDIAYMYPSVLTSKRVLADAGTIKSRSTLNELTNKFLDLLPNTKLLFCPHLAVKLRESGIYKYVTKLYDIGPAMLDGSQTTALNQPYLSGNIAQNEKYAVKNPNNGSTYLTHTPISFLSTDKWSVSTMLNDFCSSLADYGAYCGNGTSASNIYLRKTSANRLRFLSNTSVEYLFNINNSLIGKNSLITFVAFCNGTLNLYLNGKLFQSITNTDTSFIFSRLINSYLTFGLNGVIQYHSIRDIALSPTQVQDEYNYLRTLFPEIESVQIGTQVWATSNCEMTCTPQGNIIQEMQTATNVEKITNAADREFNSDTGFWTKNGNNTSIVGGSLNVTNSDIVAPGLLRYSFLILGKVYRVQYTINSISFGSVKAYAGNLGIGMPRTAPGTYTDYIIARGDNIFRLYGDTIGQSFSIDNVSIQEVGWSDSTNVYNYIYANTSGTAEQKEYAAVKAAAMWCYYNNDPALGAVYGKLYNWYAVKLLQMDIDYYNAANPTATWGWRVPTNSDFTALSTYLGGDAVAGGKLKKDGLDYWGRPNTGADNSSGFSAIPNGYRHSGGSFYSQNTASILRFINKITGECIQIGSNTSSFSIISGFGDSAGMSLRLIKA